MGANSVEIIDLISSLICWHITDAKVRICSSDREKSPVTVGGGGIEVEGPAELEGISGKSMWLSGGEWWSGS